MAARPVQHAGITHQSRLATSSRTSTNPPPELAPWPQVACAVPAHHPCHRARRRWCGRVSRRDRQLAVPAGRRRGLSRGLLRGAAACGARDRGVEVFRRDAGVFVCFLGGADRLSMFVSHSPRALLRLPSPPPRPAPLARIALLPRAATLAPVAGSSLQHLSRLPERVVRFSRAAARLPFCQICSSLGAALPTPVPCLSHRRNTRTADCCCRCSQVLRRRPAPAAAVGTHPAPSARCV